MADIEAIVVPAVATGQFTIAEATHKQLGFVTPVAFLTWGSFSADIDRAIQQSPDRPFPSGIKDWRSGDYVWVVEAVGDQRLLTDMLQKQQGGAWKGKTVRMRIQGADGKMEIRTLSSESA
jgi:hemolysin-activating ACP:hemolysin acyltransferase